MLLCGLLQSNKELCKKIKVLRKVHKPKLSKKLQAFLLKLNNAERIQFGDYLRGHPSVQAKLALRLYDFVQSYLNGKDDSWPDKETTWRHVFGKEKYDDIKLRHLSSALNRLGLDFLSWTLWENDPDEKDLNLLPELHHRDLKQHYLGIERNFLKRSEDRGRLDTGFYLNRFRYERTRRLFLEQDGVKRTTTLNLQDIDFNLDAFYFQHKLKLYCDVLNYKNFLNVDANIDFITPLLQYIEESKYIDLPAIRIYFTIYKTLSEQENEQHFEELLPLLREYGKIFDAEELDTIYIFTQNYCIKKINSGDTRYYGKLFEIYKDQIDHELLLRQGELAPWHYKNIVTVGSQTGAFEWTEQFIKDYNKFLPVDYRESALSYNKARLEFSRKNYGLVVELLREVEYHDIFYALSARWMLLKTYYELDEYKAMEALLESFRIYLRRNEQLSTQLKQQYNNMLRNFGRMLRVNPYDKAQLEEFRNDVEQHRSLSDKQWFLDKIAAL